MKRREFLTLIESGAYIAVIGLMVIAFPSTSVNAQQAPRKGCVAIDKREYDSAKREKMLRTELGAYVRTGRLWRRYYWYCHW
jgi:hypothetical protein